MFNFDNLISNSFVRMSNVVEAYVNNGLIKNELQISMLRGWLCIWKSNIDSNLSVMVPKYIKYNLEPKKLEEYVIKTLNGFERDLLDYCVTNTIISQGEGGELIRL